MSTAPLTSDEAEALACKVCGEYLSACQVAAGQNEREQSANCTRFTQGRCPIPGWLQPYKNQWLSQGSLGNLMDIEGRPFSPWFVEVRPRVKSVRVPHVNKPHEIVTRYLVKHVWAMARAHGLEVVPSRKAEHARLSESVDALRAEIYALRRQPPKVQEVTREVLVKVPVSNTHLVRLLLTAKEPLPIPGVYFLLDRDGSVAYVGQSKNVLARMAGHTEKNYSMVRMIHVQDEGQRSYIEREFIELLQPPLNSMGIRRQEVASA